MIWFSSDFHFLHRNISGPKRSQWSSGYRNFEDEYVMTDILINILNKYVKHDDILYFLGDFAFKDHTKIPELRARIACETIHFCRGNHDNHIDKYKDWFTSINDVLTYQDKNGHTFFMSHYPHLSWNHSSRGVIMLHGHEHGIINHLNENVKRVDVGIDSAYMIYKEYKPFNVVDILNITKNKENLILGHHKGQF